MLLLRKPSAESTRQFLMVQAKLNLAFSRPNHFLNPAWPSDRSPNAEQFGGIGSSMLRLLLDDEVRPVNTDW